MLSISLDEPIAFTSAAADVLRWAHCICCHCCWFNCLGPLFLQKVLPMCSDGPIISSEGAADIYGWAYCIFCCCCWFTRLSLLFLQKVLPICLDGASAFADALADQVSLLFFGRCLKCFRMGPAAVYLLEFTHYFSWRYWRCPEVGPFALVSVATDSFTWAYYLSAGVPLMHLVGCHLVGCIAYLAAEDTFLTAPWAICYLWPQIGEEFF